MALLYGSKLNENCQAKCLLVTFRNKSKNTLKLSQLPTTPDAIRLHGQPTDFQLHQWKGNKLIPTKWGWEFTKIGLMPIPTTQPSTPESLLE